MIRLTTYLFIIIFGMIIIHSNLIASPLVLDNEFLKISLNNDVENKGRFGIETTGGDPKNVSDNESLLTLSGPKPWSSYTTILIDSKPIVFGSESKKRAGKTGLYGQIITQTIEDNQLKTHVRYESIDIFQTLSFIRNPSTRVKDMVLIQYHIQNNDTKPHLIGTRIMLDTWLGSNDAAPFRIGEHIITAERVFEQSDLMSFWQAFDNVSNPSIIGQGILKHDQLGISLPDRIALVNWGTLADHPWKFDYVPDRSFVRLGEIEKDTALGLYWDPVMIQPGNSRTIRTMYGLGGVSLSPGEISLGLTAPAELFQTSQEVITVVGYIQNTGGFDSQETSARFTIPPGFKIIKGQLNHTIGQLLSGDTKQLYLHLKPDSPQKGDAIFSLQVTSTSLDSNTISRNIQILGPPKIFSELSITPFVPPYYQATLTLTNDESQPIYNIVSELNSSPLMTVPWFDISKKPLSILPESSSVSLNWIVKVNKKPTSTDFLKIETYSKTTGKVFNLQPMPNYIK